MKKKILIGLEIFILVVGLVIGGLYFYNSRKENDSFSYLILKINPELMLSFDENNIVIDIKPLNDDAKIFESEDLIGLNLETAISKVIDIALANGYLEDGLMNIIGISNFTGFSVEQAKTFIKNKGISAYEPSSSSSDDVLRDFGIDCEHTEDTTELVVCNAYAVTHQQRIQQERKKYEDYQKCLDDLLNGLHDEECEDPRGPIQQDNTPIDMPLCRDVGKDSEIPCTCGEGVSMEDCYK